MTDNETELYRRHITVHVPEELADIMDTVAEEAESSADVALTFGRWLLLGQQAEADFELRKQAIRNGERLPAPRTSAHGSAPKK